MKRLVTATLALVLLLAVVTAALGWAVLHTHTGAGWLLSLAVNQSGGNFHYSVYQGDLGSGLRLDEVRFSDDGLDLMAKSLDLAVNVDVLPPRIRIEPLRAEGLELTLPPESKDDEATPLEDMLSSIRPPLPVEVSRVSIAPMTLHRGEQSDPDRLEYVRLGLLTLNESARMDGLEAATDAWALELDGGLGLDSPFSVDVSLRVRSTTPAGPGSPDIETRLSGNLSQELGLAMTSSEPVVRLDATVTDLLSRPNWNVVVESPALQWPLGGTEEPGVRLDTLKAESSGWMDDYEVAATGRIQSLTPQFLQFDLHGDGGLDGLTVDRLTLSGEPVELSAEGVIAWRPDLGVSFDARLERLEPAAFADDFPAGHIVSGDIQVALNRTSLTVSNMNLQAAGMLRSLSGQATLILDEARVDGKLAWSDLSWPPGEQGGISSPSGDVRISGVLDDWLVEGLAAVESPDFPGGTLQVQATGNRESMNVEIERGEILGGQVEGNARWSWREEGPWSAQLTSRSLRLDDVLPDWPLRFDADVSASGTSNPLSLEVEVHELSGEMKSRPLSASGGFRFAGAQATFRDFTVRSGDSVLQLDGGTDTPAGLSFSTRIENLATLLPGAGGKLSAEGNLSLLPGQQRLDLGLEAGNLIWQGLSARTLSIEQGRVSRLPDGVDFSLSASGLMVNGQPIDTLDLRISGAERDHQIEAKANSETTSLVIELQGGFAGEEPPAWPSSWQGQINGLELTELDRLALSLASPAPLNGSANDFRLGSACLGRESSDSLCLEAEWIRGDHVSTRLHLRDAPLDLLRPFLETDLEFDQTLDGELTWGAQAGAPASGTALFHLSPGALRYPDDNDTLLRTGDGELSFNLSAGRLSEGRLHVPLPDLGAIDFSLNIPDLSAGADAALQGSLDARIDDLDVITLFIPVIDRAGGRFSADLDIGGTAGQPDLRGSIALSDGLIRHHASGLKLNDINLSGQVLNNHQSNLTGSFRALEGTGDLSASLDLTDLLAPRLSLDLHGDALKLFDAEDLTLVAQPDLSLGWQPGKLMIDGSIRIPDARIAPRFIPSSTVSESPDLVIVAGQPTETTVPEEEEPPTSVQGTLEVTLGENVQLILDHAQAELKGSARFTWNDKPVPVANGQYSMVGEIQALGQRLEISQGIISFPGVPADNPHLNVRAEREIYGNSEIRKAGVFVNGTLRRFAMEPYTEPPTNRDRARTLLVTGSDFNMEEGVGAVDIGTYIAPRIFVAYGIGVFEDENVFSVRYDLGRGWGIKATSGQRQTGVDLSYTIER